MHDLNETRPPLGQTPGHQAIIGKRAFFPHAGAIHCEDGLRFLGQIREFGHGGLHPIGHFILSDPGLDLGVAQLLVLPLVHLVEIIQQPTADGRRHAFRILQIENRTSVAAEFDPLMHGGQEAGAPIVVIECLSTRGAL